VRVALFGATGFIGTHLSEALRARGDEVVPASLRDVHAAAAAAADCDAIVNLAGENLARRWTPEVKREIQESRTATPSRFFDALHSREVSAKTYVSASAIGYYGTSTTATFTEESPPGDDFLAQLCIAWENIAQKARDFGMRVSCVRTGFALGHDGGALPRLLPIFRAGMGGPVGNGEQWVSWIHIDDLVGIYLLAIDQLEVPINATAPSPVHNRDFTHALGEALHRPAVVPTPAFAVKALLGEGATVVLDGQRVIPQRALAEGYRFKYDTIEPALRNVVSA
jgi:uncharacterized protein (TIGR01777 family)